MNTLGLLRHNVARTLLAGVCLTGLSACASHIDRIQPVRESFFAGRLQEAEERLDKQHDVRLRNDDVKELDRAIIKLASGNPRETEKTLRQIRDRFDHLEQKSVVEKGASMLADSNMEAYAGEDYEKVLIRAFLALSNLMTDGGDAGAYALQVTDKQDQIIQQVSTKNPDDTQALLAYKQVALGPYIRAMLAEESPLTLDDAARARLQVVNFAPEFRDGKSDLQRAQHEQPLPPGHGALYVFALVGRGPIKEEVAEIPTQAAMLIADQIISHNANRGLTPTLAPIKIPKVKRYFSRIDGINVHVDGSPSGRTAKLVDIGMMAEAQQEAQLPRIVAEAVVRRTVKKGVMYAAKEVTDADKGSALSFAISALGVAWEASETADTRCWALLPDTIQVLRVNLPAGEHEITLAGARGGTSIARPTQKRVQIRDGRNTYMLGMFPEDNLVGQVLVSGESE